MRSYRENGSRKGLTYTGIKIFAVVETHFLCLLKSCSPFISLTSFHWGLLYQHCNMSC